MFTKQIMDPYRWLEDPKAAETKEFVKQQNELSKGVLEAFTDRQKLKNLLTSAYDYEKFGCPFKRGEFNYFFYNSGLQAQSVLYRYPVTVTQVPNPSNCQVFFDPNKLSADGTASLATYSFSESGSLFAYGVSYAGSDWTTIKVQTASETADSDFKPLSDVIEWVKFSDITWTHDEKGFFYQSYPKPVVDDAGTETDTNTCPSLFYHRLGDKQAQDELIFTDPQNPTHMFSPTVSDDGNYLILSISNSCDPVNKLYISDLKQGKTNFNKIVDSFDALYSYVANVNSKFYFRTNLKASKYKIVCIDINKSEGFKDFLPESANDVLQSAALVAENNLILNYMRDCKDVLSVYSLENGEKIRDLPHDIGSVDSFSGRKKDKTIYFRMSSFLNPGIIYKYDFSADLFEQFYVTKLKLEGFSIDEYEQSQVFYESKDGQKIPMFVVKSKKADKSPKPVFLYGYGGFNISLTPMFSPQWLVFIQYFNGILAVANIRGGGEYGDEWHKAGSLLKKQNCFDDFQYAAKYLVSSGITKPEMIAINGGSNGGLLVAACANQAPELFGVCIAEVGVLDMLRFHKFTIGHAWRSDYGDPDVERDFEYLLTYSPLHNVSKDKNYPWLLLLTSDHDDRVVPLHSYKYIAELQYKCPDNPNPLLIRVDVNAGHGKGKPTNKRIDDAVDRLSFIGLRLKTK